MKNRISLTLREVLSFIFLFSDNNECIISATVLVLTKK